MGAAGILPAEGFERSSADETSYVFSAHTTVGRGARDLSRRNTGVADRRLEISRLLRFPTFLRTEVRAPFVRATTAVTTSAAPCWRQCPASSTFVVPVRPINPGLSMNRWGSPQGFGVRQSSGALAMQASQPKAPAAVAPKRHYGAPRRREDWRSPRRYRAIRRFKVPMHGTVRARARRNRC